MITEIIDLLYSLHIKLLRLLIRKKIKKWRNTVVDMPLYQLVTYVIYGRLCYVVSAIGPLLLSAIWDFGLPSATKTWSPLLCGTFVAPVSCLRYGTFVASVSRLRYGTFIALVGRLRYGTFVTLVGRLRYGTFVASVGHFRYGTFKSPLLREIYSICNVASATFISFKQV